MTYCRRELQDELISLGLAFLNLDYVQAGRIIDEGIVSGILFRDDGLRTPFEGYGVVNLIHVPEPVDETLAACRAAWHLLEPR